MGKIVGDGLVCVRDLVESAQGRVIWLAGFRPEQPVQDVRLTSGDAVPDGVADCMCVIAGPLDLHSTRLDSLLLRMHRQRAAGVLLPVTRLPEPTDLLARSLGFNVLGAPPEHVGDVVRGWWQMLAEKALLVRRRSDEICRELRVVWLECRRTEDFLARAAELLGGRIVWSGGGEAPRGFGALPAAVAARYAASIDWGRGLGGLLSAELAAADDAVDGAMPYLRDLVGVLVDRESMEIESELRLRGELLLELLVDRGAPTGSVLRAAERFGMDLSRENIVAIWDLDNFTELARGPNLPEIRILRLKRELMNVLEAETRRAYGDAWVLPHSDAFVVVFPGRAAEWPAGRVVDVLRGVQRRALAVVSAFGVDGITVGAGSSYSGAPGLRQSFSEAHEALLVGRAHHGANTVTHFKDLGLQRFLFGWFDSPRSRQLAVEFVKPLLEDDPHQRAELLPTLRAYLEAGSRLTPAAQALGIHRNTLRYRLDRVAQLLDLDLADPDVRLVLQLIVRVLPDDAGTAPKKP